ncbi:hypothetical protein JCM6882_008156 [Rhodosporidiobolus microsporus]
MTSVSPKASLTPLSPEPARPPSPSPSPPPPSLAFPPAVVSRVQEREDAHARWEEQQQRTTKRKRPASESPPPLSEDEPEQGGPVKDEAKVAVSIKARAAEGPAGMPTLEQFEEEVEKYLQGLHPSKRAKALMTRDLYDNIRFILAHPGNTSVGDPQLRFWARQRFQVVTKLDGPVLVHEKRQVVTRDRLYEVLCEAHEVSAHGGRDKTFSIIKRKYSYIPKEVAAGFVKACPKCVTKRVTHRGKRRREDDDTASEASA